MVLTPEEFHKQRKAFAWREGTPGISRRQLFINLADTLVPGLFEWHAWTLRIVDALCNYRWCGAPGCSNSGKTWNVSSFACLWWLAAPDESSVIFCTTSKNMLKKRAWPMVQGFRDKLAESQGEEFGNILNSQTTWQSKQGDDKHAIFGLAVEEGDASQAATKIQGIHTRRQMVIIDEAEGVGQAIWKAGANLYSYPVDAGGEFILCCLFNPRSRLSQAGRFIEPENGWNSVNVDTDEWESVPQLDGKRAMVLRFDFRKSPNIVEGRQVSRHLPSKKRVDARLAALQARGGENDPDHWCFDLAFPAPEGLIQTVFTESFLEKHEAYGRLQFTGNKFRIIGAFDYARGGATGNRPTVRFAAYGEITGGNMGIELMPPIEVYTDATSQEPPMFQMVRKLEALCNNVDYRGQKYKCEPQDFAIDVTGAGAGMGDVAQREWSPKIIRIEFGGSASDEPCSIEDPKLASERYLNKRVEMYFRTRDGTASGQIKGLDKDTAAEYCALVYTDDSVKIKLETKKEYIKRMQKSPDYADCGVMVTEVARIKGFKIAAVGHTVAEIVSLDEQVKLAQAVYNDSDMSIPEEVGAIDIESDVYYEAETY